MMEVYESNRKKQIIAKLLSYNGQVLQAKVSSSELDKLYEVKYEHKIRIVEPLKRYCVKLLEIKGEFEKAHVIFLKIVIECRAYKDAIQVLQWPLIQAPNMKSDEILEYLWYGGIIWTVLQQYNNAANFFGFINRIEKKESNIKIDAKKKLTLINILLGKVVQQSQIAIQYIPIINKLQNGQQLSKKQNQSIQQDGNINLFQKLKDILLLKQLSNMSLIYNRIPISSLKNYFAFPDVISNLNKIQHTYRYDPKSQCIIFQAKKIDLQKSISKTIKTYLQLLNEDKNSKQYEYIKEKEEREKIEKKLRFM